MTRPSAAVVVAEGADPSPGSASSVSLVSVPFQGGALLAAAGSYPEEGDRPVPLAPFCERLGINADTQRKKLARVAWTCPVIMTVQIPGDDQARRLACIPLRALAGWLFTINPGKVAPEARPALVAYQREAADVLYRHFLAPPAPAAPINPPDTPSDVAAQLAALSERLAWLEAGQGGRKLPPRSLAPVAIPEPLLRQAWAAIQRRGVWRVTPGRLGAWVKPLRTTERAKAALDGLAARGLVRQIEAHHGAAFVVVAATQAAQLARGCA
jgi:hypothetical protein